MSATSIWGQPPTRILTSWFGGLPMGNGSVVLKSLHTLHNMLDMALEATSMPWQKKHEMIHQEGSILWKESSREPSARQVVAYCRVLFCVACKQITAWQHRCVRGLSSRFAQFTWLLRVKRNGPVFAVHHTASLRSKQNEPKAFSVLFSQAGDYILQIYFPQSKAQTHKH